MLASVVSEKETKESTQQGDEEQGPLSQQPAVSRQFCQQPFFPQAPPTPPNPVMGPPNNNNNNVYLRRNNWSPFYQNCYPYVRNAGVIRRRRSHLDDVYLPNYDDEDLEEGNGFDRQRFQGKHYNWYRNNPPHRSDHRNYSNRTLAFVKRSQIREPNHNVDSETKTNDLPSKDNAASSANAIPTDSCAKNCDRRKCETVVPEVDSNLSLKSELKTEDVKQEHSVSDSKLNDCDSNAARCHNSEENLKTEDPSVDNHTSDSTDVNKSTGISSDPVSSEEALDKMKMTEETQRHELLNNFHGKSDSPNKDAAPKPKEDEASDICENKNGNSFTALMDSDEEIDCFGDFITIDNIDTSKSYLNIPVKSYLNTPHVSDDYEVIDMDISPLKRKSDCSEIEELAKKTKYDSLYAEINSDKLLTEINQVLKENKQSFEKSAVKSIKRFRSKSLTLNDTEVVTKNSSRVRSLSVDSIDKSNFKVSYNFDLKTNLLLLLKQNSTQETSTSLSNILKVLKDDQNLSTVDRSAPKKSEVANSVNKSNDSKSNVEVNGGTTEEVKQSDFEVSVEEKDDEFESSVESEESPQKPSDITDRIGVDHDLRPAKNAEEGTEKNIKPISNTQSVIEDESCIKPATEGPNDSLTNNKRKYSVGHEEQSKKICLDSTTEDTVQPIEASHPNTNTGSEVVEKEQSVDATTNSTKPELEDTNQNSVQPVPVSDKTVSKGSSHENLVDIEEELKSLLAGDSSDSQQEHVENEVQKVLRDDKKIGVDAVSTDDKSGNEKKLIKRNASADTTSTESSSIKESRHSQESNSKKPSEKEVVSKGKEKPTKNKSSSNSTQPKSKDELKKKTSTDKKQKCSENHIKNTNSADAAAPNLTTTTCENKPVLQEPKERQKASRSKTNSYHERFKRIQFLFGSDSESEMEEENMINSKTNPNVHDTPKNTKIYDKSNNRDVQRKKQVVTESSTNLNGQESPVESQKLVDPDQYYINKYVRQFSTSHSLKESNKVIEKRRCSAPITNNTIKTLDGATKTTNGTVNKPKRIEKKRRETLPASLIGESSKKDKPHSVENGQVEKSDKDKNYKKEETGKVCVINHKLRDPRKEHYKYKHLTKREQKSETDAKQCAVGSDSSKTQNKHLEKHRSHHKNEKKSSSPKSSDNNNRKKDVYEKNKESKPKNLKGKDSTPKKESSPKNLKEKDCTPKKESSTETVTNQSQSKSPKTDQIKPVASTCKEMDALKIQKEIQSKLKNGTQGWIHLQFVQCSTLPQDRFPMLQRANSCVQENDSCDKAVTLEKVDVNDKIDVVKQVVEQEDDVIEVIPEIPIIDLTNDSRPVKGKTEDLVKVEVKKVDNEVPYKDDEMITLYRSDETVDNLLDIQPTAESISVTVLTSKQSPSNKSNVNEEFTSSITQNSEKLSDASPSLYISPLSNTATVSSPARFTFKTLERVSKGGGTRNSNRSPKNVPSPPSTVSQTVQPSQLVTNNQNVYTPLPRLEVRIDNVQTNVTTNCGGGYVEITNPTNMRQVSVEQRQESVNPPTISLNRQISQQNYVPPSNALAHLQQKVANLSKPTNSSTPARQNPLYHQIVTTNSESQPSHNAPRPNAYGVHGPMRHSEEEEPTPMHEISVQEIRSTGLVLVKYLLLYESTKQAQCAYKQKLQKLQKHIPGIARVEMYHFDNYSSERDKRLYKDLVKELKCLDLSGSSSNIKSAEVLMDQVFKALNRIVGKLNLWRVYLMLDNIMQPEMAEYMAVPFLRDLFSYVSFVAGKIRSSVPATGQPENTQVASQPQPKDPFTPDQRKILEWQVKQYIAISSIQKRLTEELHSNIPKRPANSTTTIMQNMQRLPNYSSQLKNLVLRSNNQQFVKIVPGLTVHQDIIIKPINATNVHVPSAPSTCNSSNNRDTCTYNDAYKIRLPYAAPNENPPPYPSSPVQEQSTSQSVEEANSQMNTPNTQASVNTHPSPPIEQAITETVPSANKCVSVPSAPSPQGVEKGAETDNVVVKEEKEAPLLTDQEIETIDLTWIKDIDPKQLQSEMEFITVKKEELQDDEEEEARFKEEPFAVAPSPADSGISSPPIQEYDETVFSNRSCICGKVAEYVCGCMMAMYCSGDCQMGDWKCHKDVCQKYKAKNNKSQQ